MVEIVIGIICVSILMAVSFFCGMKTADRYADERDGAVDYALKRQFCRLRACVDADDPMQPYVSRDQEE